MMRTGGAKAKGSEFERKVGATLSLWLSHNERKDLFARNVLSGGAFTRRESDRGDPGDLSSAHPIAWAFLQRYMVECKHHRDLMLADFLLRPYRLTSLGKIIDKAERQAAEASRHYFLVAKQNNRDAIVLLPRGPGGYVSDCLTNKRARISVVFHNLFGGDIVCVRLDDLVAYINPDVFQEVPYDPS